MGLWVKKGTVNRKTQAYFFNATAVGGADRL